MATKGPWDNEIYKAMREEPNDLKRESRKKSQNKKPLSTRFLTFLVIVLFLFVFVALGFVLWNSQAQNNASIVHSFHSETSVSSSAKSTISTAQSSSSSVSQSSTSTSSSAATGATYTIVAGDTPSAIASKTGVPWEQIASLNNISAEGYNADGSAISPGQVLKLK
ncbi:SAG1386/EF1546 family surface-associated protein [Lactococcus nasutitermitis]|uniref:SAG1386/EF1546 family surface-associated protein n=1 Tax=Lactococcus nasutitermitis TaxID=1652957 RepID=A0ABV9JC84_9LACT|nr:SAG1386/EF1546 family surface-associated protein [Lactococcus nasutitermitis]